jgi:hypothetical protein
MNSMHRHDWVFVGIRLLGVLFVAQGIVGLPDLVDCSIRLESDTARIGSWLGNREANRP